MPRLVLILLLAGPWLLAVISCRKAELRDLETQQKKWLGTWQVAEIRTVTTDTLGRVLTTQSAPNQGSIEFRESADGLGGDAFKAAVFAGPCARAELVSYFSRVRAGDPTTAGGWSLYWDADPDGARLLLWGITGGGSYHRTVTLDSDDAQARQLHYVNRSTTRGANELTFITWSLRK